VDDFSAIDITGQLKAKHPGWIRDDLASIRLVQTSERVYLETTEEELIAGYLKDQTIRRQDLAFIVDGEEEGVMFDPNNLVEINAKKFVDDMDPWSLLHCCVEILTEDAVKIIQERHNPHKIRVNLDLWYPVPPMKGGHRHGEFTVHRYPDPADRGTRFDQSHGGRVAAVSSTL
jgi:hypothetical protein